VSATPGNIGLYHSTGKRTNGRGFDAILPNSAEGESFGLSSVERAMTPAPLTDGMREGKTGKWISQNPWGERVHRDVHVGNPTDCNVGGAHEQQTS